MNSSQAESASNISQMDSQSRPDRTASVACNFSSLPPEIREMIWLESFKTRIICLHIHQRLAPPNQYATGRDVRVYQKTVAISFSCTVLTGSNPKDVGSETPTTPDEVFQQHSNFVRKEAEKDSGDVGTLAGRSPRGPVQLYVCRESRALALKRYQRAFAGVPMLADGREMIYDWEQRSQADHQTWNRRELWEKRIWVDFERDVIFIDTMKRGNLSRAFALRLVDPLELMRLCAKEEIKKIWRLAVGGQWAMEWSESNHFARIGPSLMGSMVLRPQQLLLGQGQADIYARLPSHAYEWLTGLDSLKELLLDDSFGCKKGEIEGHVLENYREGTEEVLIDVLKYFATGQRLSAGLTWEIPEVRVLRWDEWTDFQLVGT